MKFFKTLLLVQLSLFMGVPVVWGRADGCARFMAQVSQNSSPNENEKLLKISEELSTLSNLTDERLAPSLDPFFMENTLEGMQRIFKRLSIRKDPNGGLVEFSDENGRLTTDTPAEQIRNFLNRHIGAKSLKLDERLIRLILTDAHAVLEDEDATRGSLYSVAIALRRADEYVRRMYVPDKEVDRNGDTPEEAKKKEQAEAKQEKDQNDRKEKQPAKPQYPKLAKNYTPSTKNTKPQDGGGGAQEKYVVARFNRNHLYYKLYNFNTVIRAEKDAFRATPIPGLNLNVARYENSSDQLIINTAGEKEVDLFHVPGYDLMEPQDPRAKVTRDRAGHYILKTDLPTVSIPVRPSGYEMLTPEQIEFFTRPVGFNENEFPQKMQLELFRGLKGKGSSEISREVERYIRTVFKYSVNARPEKDAIDALKAGAFQCDMAALIMVSILRDVFHIPSRAVGGFRAKRKKSDSGDGTYLVVPGDGHAWVEVFIGGKEVTFDPTPITKDEKDKKENSGDDDFQDIIDPSIPPQPPEEGQDPGQSSNEPGAEGKSSKDIKGHKERIAKESQSSVDNNYEKSEWGKAAGKKQSEKTEAEIAKEELEDDQADLIKSLEVGSLSLKPQDRRNPFVDRSYRILLQDALSPAHTRSEGIERLSRIVPYLRDSFLPVLINLAKDAAKLFVEIKGGGISEQLEDLRIRFAKQSINTTFAKVHNLIRHLELYSETLDPEREPRAPRELLATLRKIRTEIYALNGADSADLVAVRDFMKTLPPISKSIVRAKYGLDDVGRNTPTKNIASDLKNGNLRDFQLISTLSPYTDFILEVEPKPENISIKSYMEDRRRVKGRDMVPTERVSDYYKSLRMQPNKSYAENQRQGTLFTGKKRQEFVIPKDYGTSDEVERVTIVGYDTSGSMSGEPGDFQAGLIAAFIDNALSDVAPSGRHRHKAMLMGFDSNVHFTKKVINMADAKGVIANYRNQLKNTGGGTDIQKVLLEAFAAIAEAQQHAGEPLRKANIIIMTDGESTLDLEALRKARAAIDRNTPVEIMFVAINNTSKELMSFSIDSSKMGAKKGFYREFTSAHITELLAEAREMKMPEKNEAFNTEKAATAMPAAVAPLLDLAANQARAYASHLMAGRMVKDPSTWKQHLEAMPQPQQVEIKRPIEAWLESFRGTLFSHATFHDRRLLQLVVDDFMLSFAKITGVPFTSVTHREMEATRHLLRESNIQR